MNLKNEIKFRVFLYSYIVISLILILILTMRIIDFVETHPHSPLTYIVYVFGFGSLIHKSISESLEQYITERGSFFISLTFFCILGALIFYFVKNIKFGRVKNDVFTFTRRHLRPFWSPPSSRSPIPLRRGLQP